MNLRKTMFLAVAAVMLLSMGAASQSLDIYTIGGFEGTLPSFWNIGNQPTNSTLTWATDQSRSLGHSLKITKTERAIRRHGYRAICAIFGRRRYRQTLTFFLVHT